MKVINTWIFNTTISFMGRTVAGTLIIYECEGGKWCKLEDGQFKSLTEDEALVIIKPIQKLKPEDNATNDGQNNIDGGILEQNL